MARKSPVDGPATVPFKTQNVGPDITEERRLATQLEMMDKTPPHGPEWVLARYHDAERDFANSAKDRAAIVEFAKALRAVWMVRTLRDDGVLSAMDAGRVSALWDAIRATGAIDFPADPTDHLKSRADLQRAIDAVIRWCTDFSPDPQWTIAATDRPGSPAIRHSDDFASVNWGGKVYEFTPNQAACVRVLYENLRNGTPVVGEQTILEKV